MPGGNKKVTQTVTFLLPPGTKGLKEKCDNDSSLETDPRNDQKYID